MTGSTSVYGLSPSERLNVVKDVTVGENTSIGENMYVNRTITTNALSSITINGVQGRALTIGHSASSQLFIKGNATIDQCTINNNLFILGTTKLYSIRGISGNLSLGKNGSIRIIEHSDGYPNDV